MQVDGFAASQQQCAVSDDCGSARVEYRSTVLDGCPLAQYPFQNFPIEQQPITPSSYVDIDQQLPPQVALPALTLECWVRPWRV